jgi:hypothetical protein
MLEANPKHKISHQILGTSSLSMNIENHRRLSISPHIMPHVIPTMVERPLNPKLKLHSNLRKDEMDRPLWCIGFEETESI